MSWSVSVFDFFWLLFLVEILLIGFLQFQRSRKSGNVRPPKEWAGDEEQQLRELYEEFRIANGEYEHFCCQSLNTWMNFIV
jgi:hypothetical protein